MYDLENHKYLTMYIIVIINFVSNPKRSCAIPMVEMSAWELKTNTVFRYIYYCMYRPDMG